ncbi:MAG: membrane integrity-associated transporter subunit PqiC [Acetobacteraceae bacterium]|nr:membrane integrity-associated transporter subunit PqiC [Acetobacteraceae bacterium]
MTEAFRRRSLLVCFASAAVATGCRSPNPELYTVAAVPGRPQPGGPKVVAVREVSLARYLERQAIVRSSEGYQLQVEANDWWGETPGAMVTRVLEENLAQRLPGTSVFGEGGAIGANADATVELNIMRMDADRTGAVILAAQVAVSPTKGRHPPITRAVRFSVQPPSPDVRGEVSAISTALGQLADVVATMLRSLR